MKSRIPIIALLCLVCLIMLLTAWSKGRQVADLREKQKGVLAQLSGDVEPAKTPALVTELPKPEEQNQSNSSELLRLRAEVSRLTRRKQELSSVVAENQRLKARLAAAATNAQGTLPPGYIRKSAAQNVGYDSPQATMESFLWAVQSKNITNVLEVFTPEAALNIQRSFERDHEFFKNAGMIPGFRIARTDMDRPDHAKLYLEILPGTEPVPIDLRLVNGQWKLTSL